MHLENIHMYILPYAHTQILKVYFIPAALEHYATNEAKDEENKTILKKKWINNMCKCSDEKQDGKQICYNKHKITVME